MKATMMTSLTGICEKSVRPPAEAGGEKLEELLEEVALETATSTAPTGQGEEEEDRDAFTDMMMMYY